MSILQNYKKIREELGEERYDKITKYLAKNPHLLLSDIYYNEDNFKKAMNG